MSGHVAHETLRDSSLLPLYPSYDPHVLPHAVFLLPNSSKSWSSLRLGGRRRPTLGTSLRRSAGSSTPTHEVHHAPRSCPSLCYSCFSLLDPSCRFSSFRFLCSPLLLRWWGRQTQRTWQDQVALLLSSLPFSSSSSPADSFWCPNAFIICLLRFLELPRYSSRTVARTVGKISGSSNGPPCEWVWDSAHGDQLRPHQPNLFAHTQLPQQCDSEHY